MFLVILFVAGVVGWAVSIDERPNYWVILAGFAVGFVISRLAS